MRALTVILVAVLLLSTAAAQEMPPAAVKVDAVVRQAHRETVSGVATVEPWLRTFLGAETSGLVTEYPLREGDPVTAGKTLVCQLDKESLLIDLAEAEALLARAEAEAENAVSTAKATVEELKALLTRADNDLARAKELFRDQVITKAELDRAESDAIAARYQLERAQKKLELAQAGADPAAKAREAEVRRAKARLDRVRLKIDQTRIVSPVTGRVVRRMTEVGGWMNAGGTVIEVVTLDPVLVRLPVNEKDIAQLAVGDPAIIRVDARPDRTFEGKVRFIVPEADVATRAFPVLVEVPNPKLELLAGMFARAELVVGREKEVLTVPKDAIITTPQGSMIYTFEAAKGGPPTAKPVPVVEGEAVDGRVIVTGEGLAEGMPVITTGNETLFPGRPVIPQAPGGPGGPGGHGGPGGGHGK